jgi:hypothetical protein
MEDAADMRVIRTFGLPAALVAVTATVFFEAFSVGRLLIALGFGIVLGIPTGSMLARASMPWFLSPIVFLSVTAVGIAGSIGRIPTPSVLRQAFATFLTVGLPADGLNDLTLVPFLVLLPVAIITAWASHTPHTVVTAATPIAGVLVGSLLVATVGAPNWTAPLLIAATFCVLVIDARVDIANLPPLVGSSTEARRQLRPLRTVAQTAVLVIVTQLVAIGLPSRSPVDIRRWSEPSVLEIKDPSPLAVVAGWQALKDSPGDTPYVAVTVEGPQPGRMRVAVLNRYTPNGWQQASTFIQTGRTLANDPVLGTDNTAETVKSSLSAELLTTEMTFRTFPTAGRPLSVKDPTRVLFAPRGGLLIGTNGLPTLAYETSPFLSQAPIDSEIAMRSVPASLLDCPSPALRSAAGFIAANQASDLDKLDSIKGFFLGNRRFYDPIALGGQTLAGVESFVEQEGARGNLEVFVTAVALLARCSGVPVRIAVGFPAPEADAQTGFFKSDITAWIEVPFEEEGWIPYDPLPTAEELERQAQRLVNPPANPELPEPPEPTTPATVVDPLAPEEPSTSKLLRNGGIAVVLSLALVAAWVYALPDFVVRRRRRIADPSEGVRAAWTTVTEELLDRNIPIGAHHTPNDIVRGSAGHTPVTVPRLLAELAPIVDRVRYSGEPATAEDAGTAWALTAVIRQRLPRHEIARHPSLRVPIRQARRLRSALGLKVWAQPWNAPLPASVQVRTDEAPRDIPEVAIDAAIGEGSTGTVFRGVLAPTGTPVAVKVFRYGPGDVGFDLQRFEWEVRIAKQVSGLPHLPEVYAAGISPLTERPYIVSSLYERGTLLDRVRKGGPMSTEDAVDIGVEIGLALETLHQLGVIHADIKPENIFASPEGWVLGDLGSAWLRASHGPAARITPPYAAPEVWRGANPSTISDLYSLALTMLFAVSGRVPIAGGTPVNDDLDTAFVDFPVVLQALETDPRRRPKLATEFVNMLRPLRIGASRSSGVLNLPTPTITVSRT